MRYAAAMQRVPHHFSRALSRISLLLGVPAWLALLFSIVLPQQWLQWLALLLASSVLMTLAGLPALHGEQPAIPAAGLKKPRLAWAGLLLASLLVALFLPLPAGLLLVALARLVWNRWQGTMPGFPLLEAALLLGAARALIA